MYRDEAAAGNRVAGRVHGLHLDRNAITVVLPDWIAAADRDAERDARDDDDDDVGSADLEDADEETTEPPSSLVPPWLCTNVKFALGPAGTLHLLLKHMQADTYVYALWF